jgi:hypothetical protein
MGARKIKKKLRLHKAAPVPPKSAGYRTPFNDDQSPLRIAFDDHDEARGDLKLANIRGIDGNYRQRLIPEGYYDLLHGKLSQELMDFHRAETGSDTNAEEMRATAEKMIGGMLSAIPDFGDGKHPVELIRTTWIGMLKLCLWCQRNDVNIFFDAEADLIVSGYQLFKRGYMDQRCNMLGVDALTDEERKEHACVFDLMTKHSSQDDMMAANRNAQQLMMPSYANFLHHYESTEPPAEWVEFCPNLLHNLRAVKTWFAEQAYEHMRTEQGLPEELPEGFTVSVIDRETGEMETLLGPELPEHAVTTAALELEAMLEGRLMPGPTGVQ